MIFFFRKRADAVEWRIGKWEPCTRSDDTGLDDNQGIRRRKISCVMIIHDGIKLEVCIVSNLQYRSDHRGTLECYNLKKNFHFIYFLFFYALC